MMSVLQSQCIFFISVLLCRKSECTFIPVVGFKESSGLSPILSSVECTGLNLCNATLDYNQYLNSSDTCCGSTHNGTGVISKMRLLVLNSHGHILWGVVFTIGQQNESWIDTDHLVMTSDNRTIGAIDAMSYDPVPQELCFYADANKTFTTFSVVISKDVSYYILSRNIKGSPLPSGVEKNVSLLNDLSYQPLLGSFIRNISNTYIEVISDVPILVGRINLEILNYDDMVATLNCEKQWELEYNIKSCDYQDTKFFTYNYTMNVDVICDDNVGMIYVETVLVSCLRIYPEFDSDFDSSSNESIQFSLDILGPKGTSSFVRGSQLIMEEYWSSGVGTDGTGSSDGHSTVASKANTSSIISGSETNPTFPDLVNDIETEDVSESINLNSIHDTAVDPILQTSEEMEEISPTMSVILSSERSPDSTENLVSEFQSTFETLTENEVEMISSASVTSEDADTVFESGTVDLSATFSYWQSKVDTKSLESDSSVKSSEMTSIMDSNTEYSASGSVDTVSSMVVEQESSEDKPSKHDNNEDSDEELEDDTSSSLVGNWISTMNKNIFSLQTYFVISEVSNLENLATVDATTPPILDITKSLLHEVSQTSGDVLYASTMVYNTTIPSPHVTLEEMCKLINARENATQSVQLTSEKCQEEINIVDSSGTPCQCQCRPKEVLSHILQEPIEEKVEKIVKELTVDKKALSSTTRKLTSAHDPRKSSQTIGAIGIALLVTVGALIVSLDIPHIIDLAMALKHKLQTSKL